MIIENIDSEKEQLDINFEQNSIWTIDDNLIETLQNATVNTYPGTYTDNSILKWSVNFDKPIENEKLVEIIVSAQLTNICILFRGFRKDWVSNELMENHYVRDYQINMINKIYLNSSYDKNGYVISVSHTRPFGNTSTWADIANEIIKCDKIYGDYTVEKELEIFDLDDQLFEEMDKINKILIDLIKEYPVPHNSFTVAKTSGGWNIEKEAVEFIRKDEEDDYIIPITPKTYFFPDLTK